jgi:ABC-type glycerol-3-phosphate transport system substrate-binding protein
MKKRTSIFYWGLCLAIILSACKPQSTPVAETSTPTQPAETAIPEIQTATSTKIPDITVDPGQLKGLQITFLHPWSGATGGMMDLLVDEFNQSNEWGIHINLQEPGSQGLMNQALEAPAVQDAEIDLVAAPVSELLLQDQTQRKVVDLNPYVQSSKYGFTDDQRKDFLPAFWNENLLDGKLYGIPAQETASVLFYNNTWATELGYSKVPVTADNFKLQVCAANATFKKDNDRSNDGVGGWIISEDADTLLSWLHSFNALDLTKPVEKFSASGTQNAFQYLFDLQRNACAWPSRVPDPYDYFATRQALAYSGSLEDIMPQTAAFERSGNQDNWQVMLYPSESDPRLITEGLSFGVFKTDEAKQLAAWLFIRWISQPENQGRLLQTSGTLPIGNAVNSQMTAFIKKYPKWSDAVTLIPFAKPMAAQANIGIVKTALGDAGSFLLRPEFTPDQIPALMQQLDDTIQELSKRQP